VKTALFETYNGATYTLDVLWTYQPEPCCGYYDRNDVPHDMFRVADVDQDGSDDEILLGCMTLNADGSMRYDLREEIGTCGGTDLVLLGYFDPGRPRDLVAVTGDAHGGVTAYWARDGQVLWSYAMRSMYSWWTHFHGGWLRNSPGGAEVLVVDRNSDAWIHIHVPSGEILGQGPDDNDGARPVCWGQPIKWDEDDYDDCRGRTGRLGRIDIGGPGCEEEWGRNGATLQIEFNTSCDADFPSRYANRHYRQDAAQAASGYSTRWMGALVMETSGAPGTTFADVPASHWAYGYIEALYQGGYIVGCAADPRRYCPGATMTRAEGAVFVERGVHGAGYMPQEPPGATFADVPRGEWYFKWAEGLWADGYTAGCGTAPLVFCPLQGHRRAEAAVFFLRMLHGPDYLPPPPDVQVYEDVAVGEGAPWFSKWVMAAYSQGLTEDCEDAANRGDAPYRPLEAITRAEAACMMAKAKGLP
jgi:hypothetical protein